MLNLLPHKLFTLTPFKLRPQILNLSIVLNLEVSSFLSLKLKIRFQIATLSTQILIFFSKALHFLELLLLLLQVYKAFGGRLHSGVANRLVGTIDGRFCFLALEEGGNLGLEVGVLYRKFADLSGELVFLLLEKLLVERSESVREGHLIELRGVLLFNPSLLMIKDVFGLAEEGIVKIGDLRRLLSA